MSVCLERNENERNAYEKSRLICENKTKKKRPLNLKNQTWTQNICRFF